MYAAFRRFWFKGSASSGSGPYGTAVSGDFRNTTPGSSVGGACFLANGTAPLYALKKGLPPTVCRDPAAAQLFTFDWRCIQPALRFFPFRGLQRHCRSAEECVSTFYPGGKVHASTERSRCPPNVRILRADLANHRELCLSPENSAPVPCAQLGCLDGVPRLPRAPAYVISMYANQTFFEQEVRLHAALDARSSLLASTAKTVSPNGMQLAHSSPGGRMGTCWRRMLTYCINVCGRIARRLRCTTRHRCTTTTALSIRGVHSGSVRSRVP